jgi:hypothetical protein
MPGTPRKHSKARTFEVMNSFDGLDKGDRFTADDEGSLGWANGHAETGYLRDVTEEVPADASEVSPG